jgi:two-component system, chemotaxis family, CheB/CheR fusion protein
VPDQQQGKGAAPETSEVMRYVCIVASAGGLKPIQEIFANLTSDTGTCFIVMQHLSTKHDSMLAPLIAKCTDMPVVKIEAGDTPCINTVYVSGAGHFVTLESGKFSFETLTPTHTGQELFDRFLISLAQYSKKAVAVVLSGAGEDGARGALVVKEAGGLVLVQDPSSAEFSAMPERAIDVSAPDLILSPRKIASLILMLADESRSQGSFLDSVSLDYLRVLSLLRNTCNVDFSDYKPATIQRRINRRIMLHRMQDDPQRYWQLLKDSDQERLNLSRDFLIGVSRFFRDSEAFSALQKHYIPEMMRNTKAKDFRIWVAGCAGGEEAYTLAIICLECQQMLGLDLNIQILASDINTVSLDKARHAYYLELESQVPKDLLARYFNKKDKGYRVKQQVRDLVVFFQHDITRDIPFSNVDLVTCRNMLIYLNNDMQQQVLACLGFALKKEGLLMLSPSETLGNAINCYSVLDERWRIYQLVDKPRFYSSQLPGWQRRDGNFKMITKNNSVASPSYLDDIRDRLLTSLSNRYVPLMLVVNNQGDIAFVKGNTHGLLQFPEGEPQMNLSCLIDTNLRLLLQSVLQKASKGLETQSFNHVPVNMAGEDMLIDLHISNIPARMGRSELHAILFETIKNSPKRKNTDETPSFELSEVALHRIEAMEQELLFTKQSLRSALEDLEASNEELQSANEEMQSGNEELQSTNEELQSTNEELITVNSEYQQKMMELSQASDDIKNLLLSSELAVLFVDTKGCLRLFSEGVNRVLNIVEADIGRPLSHLPTQLKHFDFTHLMTQVCDEDGHAEQEVQSFDGRLFLVRCGYFKAENNKRQGYVFSFADITSIRHSQEKERLLATVVTSSNDAISMQDLNGNITLWNQTAEYLYGWTEAQACTMKASALIPASEVEVMNRAWQALSLGRPMPPFETKRLHQNGEEIEVMVTLSLLKDDEGRAIGITSIERDITKLKLEQAAEQLAAVAFNTMDAIVIADAKGTILKVNNAFCDITRFNREEVLGKPMSILHSEKHTEIFYRKLWSKLLSAGSWSGEVWHKRKNGEVFPEWTSMTVVRDPQGHEQVVGIFRDMTDQKANEAEIHKLAYFDSLTGLPNRRLLTDRISQAIISSSRNQRYGALLYLDLDQFKYINDSLGHNIGDKVLLEVSQRLISLLGEEETVARIGGDEFVILLEDLDPHQQIAAQRAEVLASEIIKSLGLVMKIDSFELHTTPSIGITLFPNNGDNPQDLLRQADNAMYLAKKKGRNTLRFFDPGIQLIAEERLGMENALRKAILNQEFELFYQPQVAQEAGLFGTEALIRWHRPDVGLVSPDSFITLAEETGLILPIGRWVLEQACLQMHTWLKDRPELGLQRMSVNISARQFMDAGFVACVEQVLTETGLAPQYLELEVTESLLLDDFTSLSEKMLRLKKMGIRFSIDDFGTGYSSLAYLRQLPIDQIKIDKSFTKNILENQDDASIVQTIIAMGLKLRLDVIAEGVETEPLQAFLYANGCSHYQGYLFGKPMPADEFVRFNTVTR